MKPVNTVIDLISHVVSVVLSARNFEYKYKMLEIMLKHNFSSNDTFFTIIERPLVGCIQL